MEKHEIHLPTLRWALTVNKEIAIKNLHELEEMHKLRSASTNPSWCGLKDELCPDRDICVPNNTCPCRKKEYHIDLGKDNDLPSDEIDSFPCSYCSAAFQSKQALEDHIKQFHVD